MAFSLNQMSAVILPVLSDMKKLIWVRSNQINLPVHSAAELDKAFNQFPYLTQNQTAALAQRCSLHPDQVKVWFMLQRLCYGISWDYQDILEVWRKMKSNQGKEEPENPMQEEDRDVDKKGKERRAHEDVVERAEEKEVTRDEVSKPIQSETTVFTRKKKKKKSINKILAVQQWPPHNSSVDLMEVKPVVANKSRTLTHRVTQTHVAMMRQTFLRCQYPNREDYDRLEMSGIPHNKLVQWFNDMRYYIKKGRPCWMNQEQHSQALANVKSRQLMNSQAKAQSEEWKMKLEKYSEDEE